MPKTTNGDGMERRAANFLYRRGQPGLDYDANDVQALTRLLRKVAREAARDRDKVMDKWYDDFYKTHQRYPTVAEFVGRLK